MWIIPKNHQLASAFAPDTVASKEELSEHLEDELTHSLMSRSKTIPLKTWCRRWKTDSSVPALFGRTLKPSHAKRFEEELTSSLEDIRANRFLQQGTDLEKTTQDTCGLTSPKLYEVSVQGWSSLKTSKDISTEDSKKSCKTWKSLVTKRRGEYSQRLKQAHLIRERESLSSENYPTPRVGGQGFNASEARRNSPNLETTVILKESELSWPTATASDPEGGPQKDRVELTDSGFKLRKKGKEHMTYGAKLRDAVEFHEDRKWPTATARDWKGVYPPTGLIRNDGKLRCDLLTDAVEYLPQTDSGKLTKEDVPNMVKSYKMLNPSWVESLMGLPEGWTQLGTLSEVDWNGWPSRPGTEQYEFEAPRTLPKGDEGLENRVDRLRMLGNGVVPQSAEIALEVLSKQLMEM